jgi:PAS domain S-box-containing protein
MLIVDPENGRIMDANTAACRYYGYSREEITGLVITDINIAPAESIRSDMSRAAGIRGETFHFRHRKKNGEIREVEVFSAPILIQGKKFLHSIVHEVTACR